ncbi:MAG: peptidoglycan editing factor PgeF [Desulfobacterales bacterium]|nr:peptidoglycan editing factor PgeF [Desulfobacterales bacterium]
MSTSSGSHSCRRSRRCCYSLQPLFFPPLSRPEIFHGVFSRHGGTSPRPWDSLNVGLQVGDTLENVRVNRERIKKEIRIKRLAGMHQVHGSRVRAITAIPDVDLDIDQCDGLITDRPGIGLMVQQADCQAVMFHDPVHRAVGIVHAGWRGTVAKIIGVCVSAMQEHYGTRPADLVAAVSPSLGPCCAEFKNFSTELPGALHRYQVRPAYFDFRAISRSQLRAAGIPARSISVSEICTVCNRDYFSFRRDRVTGRFASVIGLRG